MPDPLQDALVPNAAQRACIRDAAELAARYPGRTVEWNGMAGFSAHDGHGTLGPVSTAPALEALLYAVTMGRRRLAS